MILYIWYVPLKHNITLTCMSQLQVIKKLGMWYPSHSQMFIKINTCEQDGCHAQLIKRAHLFCECSSHPLLDECLQTRPAPYPFLIN